MSSTNGTAPAEDGPRDKLTGAYTDEEMERRIRELGERSSRSSPVTVRQVEPEPRATAGGDAPVDPSDIYDWLLDNGPATVIEIAAHFRVGGANGDRTVRYAVDQLRVKGKVQRTGRTRGRPGKPGRPSAEFEAIERESVEPTAVPPAAAPDPPPAAVAEKPPLDEVLSEYRREGALLVRGGEPDARTSHARTGDVEAEQPAAETPPGDAAAADRSDEEGHAEKDAAADGREAAAPASPVTVGDELEVRYIRALIGQIERSSVLGDKHPPEHIYDRIERLLGLEGAQ